MTGKETMSIDYINITLLKSMSKKSLNIGRKWLLKF